MNFTPLFAQSLLNNPAVIVVAALILVIVIIIGFATVLKR